MKKLAPDANRLVDGYLRSVRMAATQCPAIDPLDIESDVREHIQRAIEDSSEPVDATRVSQILERLGSPLQWLREGGETTDWHRLAMRLRQGPEDWRLAYLSFALLFAAMSFRPMLAAGVTGAFLAARAAVSSIRLRAEPAGAQRWFVWPALFMVYVPLASMLLLWPIAALRFLADLALDAEVLRANLPPTLLGLAERLYAVRLTGFDPVATTRALLNVGHYFSAAVGVWWMIVGLLLTTTPRVAESLFRPFLDRQMRRVGGLIGVLGILLLAFALARGLVKVI